MSKYCAKKLLQDALNEPNPTPPLRGGVEGVSNSFMQHAEYIGKIQSLIKMAINEL